MNITVFFLGDLCFDKFIHLSLGQILEVIPSRYINEQTVPFYERPEAPCPFCYGFIVILTDRSICLLLRFYIADRFFRIDGLKIGAARNRDKFIAPFYVWSEPANIYGQF